jgi:arylsulfatase A-like enzyme
VDWTPTLANLAGAKLEEDPAWDGMDIWPFLANKEQPSKDRQLYWVWGPKRNRVALRKGDWKLCRNNATKWELYNLADDPYETTDLAKDMPDKVEQLKSLIRKEKQKDNL